MPRKVFTAGEVLAASDVNDFLMDQTVMVFAGTAARGSAIPTPSEGMYAHLHDTDALQYYDGSSWVSAIPASNSAILQVVSATKTDTFSTGATTFQDITGLSVTITPSATSSKIMVFASVFGSSPSTNTTHFGLLRGASEIARSTTASSVNASGFIADIPSSGGFTVVTNFLDSPNTTSATTYKVAMRQNSGGTGWINRRNSDDAFGGFSSITVMEVAG